MGKVLTTEERKAVEAALVEWGKFEEDETYTREFCPICAYATQRRNALLEVAGKWTPICSHCPLPRWTGEIDCDIWAGAYDPSFVILALCFLLAIDEVGE